MTQFSKIKRTKKKVHLLREVPPMVNGDLCTTCNLKGMPPWTSHPMTGAPSSNGRRCQCCGKIENREIPKTT